MSVPSAKYCTLLQLLSIVCYAGMWYVRMYTHVYVDESVKGEPTSSGRGVCALSERPAEKLAHQSRQWLSGFSQEVDSCCSTHCQEPCRSATYRGVQLAPNVCVVPVRTVHD